VTANDETGPLPPAITKEINRETVNGSMAGIDVHKKMLAVVIGRQPAEQVEYSKRTFGTSRR